MMNTFSEPYTSLEQKVDGFPNLNKCTWCVRYKVIFRVVVLTAEISSSSSSFFAVYSMCKISERNYGNLTSAESWKKECKNLNFETTKQDGDGGITLSYPKWANPDWGSYDEGYYNVLDLFHGAGLYASSNLPSLTQSHSPSQCSNKIFKNKTRNLGCSFWHSFYSLS